MIPATATATATGATANAAYAPLLAIMSFLMMLASTLPTAGPRLLRSYLTSTTTALETFPCIYDNMLQTTVRL
jgi:predicted metal-binding membrane protein